MREILKPDAPIRKMALDDVPQVVLVHLESFQGFFLSFLGLNFLNQLYTSILEDPSGIAWVSENKGIVVGFVAGTSQPAGFYRRLIERKWWRFGMASLGAFLRQPSILSRLLRVLKMPDQNLPGEQCGILLSLAVLPEYQGNGIGKSLVLTFLNDTHSRGLEQLILTTDRNHNDRVNGFYQDLGFTIHRIFTTPESREMNEYLIQLH
jgi:ribosomal protein S18 acetylase RimI-like enzyme